MPERFAQHCRLRAARTIAAVIVLGVLFLTSLWLVSLGSISSARKTAIDHTQIEAYNLAAAFADEVSHSLDNVTAAMDIVAQRMRADPKHFDIYAWSREIPILARATVQGSIIDPNGRLAGSTLDPAAENVDLSDREHFRIHLDGQFKGVFISKPVIGRISHQTTIQVSRRVDDKAGAMLGVIVFSLSPASLTNLHLAIDLGIHGTLALARLDDVVLVRFNREHPDGLAGVGQSIAGEPRPTTIAANDSGTYIRKSVIDGTVRQYSYRRVGDYPLVVTVGLELDEALVGVRSNERTVLTIAGTASLIFIGLAAFLAIEIWRRGQNEIALATGHAKLEADVALRRQMEQQLLHAEKMEAIGTLAGGVAHELNNALLPIVVLTRLLLDKLPEVGIEHECAHNISLASDRARGLVKGILAFSRKHESTKTDVDFERLISDLLPMLEATLPKSIRLTTELSPVPVVNADAHALQGIIVNLVTNAVHAIGTAAGRITIALEPSDMPATGGTSPAIRLKVTDTGCGMDAKTLDRIFEPFFTTKEVGVGTGLGLSVAHGVVADHNGQIAVRSELGKGTEFSIYLPAAAAPHPAQLFDQAA